MKKILIALAAGIALSTAAQAQSADSKREWANKVVALQQGPELDRLVEQLAVGSSQELLQNWGPKLENIPKARQQQAKDQLNDELKKYIQDVSTTLADKIKKVSADSLVPAYTERFTLDELKQLAAFFESPAVKKYQTAAPELGNVFVQQLIEATRVDVQARARQFDEVATKVVGSTPTPKATPADAGKSKTPAKK